MVLDRQIAVLKPDHPVYPASPRNQANASPFCAAGPIDILGMESTGFFCSSQCPGGAILKTFDAITAMRDERRREQRAARFFRDLGGACTLKSS